MHRTTERFWKCYGALPPSIQRSADRCYEQLKSDPQHASLHFKRVGKYWSVRAGESHRALGVDHADGIIWFWIGPHAEYERLIANS
jgi:hypothetical protein